MSHNLLDVNDLVVDFITPEGRGRAVDHVNFSIAAGETLGLVGESGSGKSVTAMSILGLIPTPPGQIHCKGINLNGRELSGLNDEQMRRIRGRRITMIFQEPMTSLNPVLTIGRQVAEPLMVHQNLSRADAWSKACRWLDRVKIPAAKKRMNDYPYQLSGGMRQRVMIAMALVCRPRLLIADEPTTALDVTIQSQILALMEDLKNELNMSVLMITHNLGVVAQMASRVIVMYAGQVVEQTGTKTLFKNPLHPYTRGLLKSMPQLGSRAKEQKQRLVEIPGTVPSITTQVKGCKFASRCTHVFDRCRENQPGLLAVKEDHQVRCWLYAKKIS